MQKLTVKYADDRVDSIVVPETVSISSIINQILASCERHNVGPPEFIFDDWENQELSLNNI